MHIKQASKCLTGANAISVMCSFSILGVGLLRKHLLVTLT